MKKVKASRPKALCFDYLQLKDAFGLDLETEIVNEASEEVEDEQEDRPTESQLEFQ